MSLKKSQCKQCRAPLFEALLDGTKVMIDWEPSRRLVGQSGAYFLVKGDTDMPTIKHFALTDEWPAIHDNRWTLHACNLRRVK